MQTVEMIIPAHWLSALINADPSGLEVDDEQALDAFTHNMMEQYGQCLAIDYTSDDDENHPGFITWHDARAFSPYAADCALVTFDIG